MDSKQAQEEISVITMSLTLIGLILPGAGIWLVTKMQAVTLWMLEKGLLERSDRVVWVLQDGIGLDIGRILILIGCSMLCMVAFGWFVKLMVDTSRPVKVRVTQ